MWRRVVRHGMSLTVVLALCGCAHKRPPPPRPPSLKYVLEPAWQAGPVWFYPHETFALDQTGIAAILPAAHPALTSDNEVYDPGAMAAAMQSVQLPAIATVTNLENGREVEVRVNDRGPPDPARLIAFTPRVALLLAIGGPTARVRVRLDPDRSAALAHQIQGHAGDLAIEAAPRGMVQQAELAPLPGSGQEVARAARRGAAVAQASDAAAITVPLRLPERLVQGMADPGTLMIDAGTFTYESAARRRVAAMQDNQARLVRSFSGGVTTYDVRAGPFADVAEADAALGRMIADGITDARIVVDLP